MFLKYITALAWLLGTIQMWAVIHRLRHKRTGNFSKEDFKFAGLARPKNNFDFSLEVFVGCLCWAWLLARYLLK